jgi:CSLREA domain-containing protein
LIILLPAGLFATTFPVTKTADTNDGTCDADCSLREAIDAANTNPGADDVPVPSGTYLLALGQLVVSDDVRIAGAGQANTIIDGNATDRVFEIQGGVVEISGVAIQNGRSGIANIGELNLTNSTVSGHSHGGIQNYGTATLTNSAVSGNSGSGGIYNYGELNLTSSTVSGNHANGWGGGIANSYIYGTATLINSTVSGNHARHGGGISNRYGDLTLTNSTVSGNSANDSIIGWPIVWGTGGGIWNHRGDIALINSTVSGNEVNWYGGGINNISGTVTATNTIIADNISLYSPGIDNCYSPINSLGYNLTDDTTCEFSEPTDLVAADAMLGPLQDNGGPTETHDLIPGSPAIDAGSVSCPPPGADQRGVARPQGAACDIGAFELEQATTILVAIDIKPDSDANPIYPRSRGVLPVAILSSESFDVEDVDVTTLAFGPDAAAPAHDLTEPGVLEDHLRDVNADGSIDLVPHYRSRETGITSDDLEACMSGALADGMPFEGCDSIRTLQRRRGIRR